MSQLLLIPDPRPLGERLGESFFREAPERPGVYLMKDAADRVLYVGKAKNLKQRLQHYRIANPDRMPRRHLRMLRQVARIDFQFCAGDSAALKQESRLLRSLRPGFNRAGVWTGKSYFLSWRTVGSELQIAVVDVPEPGWHRFGPFKSGAVFFHATLCRVVWLALNPGASISQLPLGWMKGTLANPVKIHCGSTADELSRLLEDFFWTGPPQFIEWLHERLGNREHQFERTFIEAELEAMREFAKLQKKHQNQLALL